MKTFINSLVIMFILCSFTGEVLSADIDELLAKAGAGDVAAQVELADYYKKLPEPDYEKAAMWFTRAAAAGNPYAQVELGVMYWNGFGVIKDDNKAFVLMKQAADQDFARGYGGIGFSYQWGKGVKQDYAEAAKWYRKAAEMGNLLAQVRLAILYKFGNGVPEDGKAAEALLLQATGHESSPFLGMAYYEMGKLYAEGAKGVTTNEEEAIGWFQIAMDHGNKMAYVHLSALLSNNKGTEDHETAFRLNKEVAEQGFVPSMNDLAVLYEKGVGTPKNFEKAFYWYKKAAEAGLPISQYNLGVSYEFGQGVPADLKTAYEWYNKAAENGYKDSIKKREKLRKSWEFDLKGAYFTPNPINPGEKGSIVIQYIPPDSSVPVEIKTSLSLWFGEMQIIPPFERGFILDKDQTEQVVSLPLPIPEEAENGVYKVVIKTTSFTDEEESQAFFEIR